MFNRLDCRWEEQSLHTRAIPESLKPNVLQCLGKSNETKGMSVIDSTQFNYLDIVTHLAPI